MEFKEVWIVIDEDEDPNIEGYLIVGVFSQKEKADKYIDEVGFVNLIKVEKWDVK